MELNVLVEAKKEYLNQLCIMMCPFIIEAFEEMYKKAEEMSRGRQVLIQYQQLLKDVQTWNDSIIKNHNIDKIDLVKIDVEGAELMVMKSISKEAFSRIKQIVIEVHDIDDRTNVLTSMLREHGFNVKKSERESLETQNLFRLDTLYAVRQ
jgi:hypothetical protein